MINLLNIIFIIMILSLLIIFTIKYNNKHKKKQQLTNIETFNIPQNSSIELENEKKQHSKNINQLISLIADNNVVNFGDSDDYTLNIKQLSNKINDVFTEVNKMHNLDINKLELNRKYIKSLENQLNDLIELEQTDNSGANDNLINVENGYVLKLKNDGVNSDLYNIDINDTNDNTSNKCITNDLKKVSCDAELSENNNNTFRLININNKQDFNNELNPYYTYNQFLDTKSDLDYKFKLLKPVKNNDKCITIDNNINGKFVISIKDCDGTVNQRFF